MSNLRVFGTSYTTPTSMSKLSNSERSVWREKCRRELAHHINDTLGLKIHPPDVRLIPNATDPYSWGPIPGKETMFKDILFAKHLSKLSIGPLMELCRGVGKTFRAIKPADLPPDCSHKSDAKVERGRLFQEENDIVQDMRRRLRGYKRKHKILWDHIEKQDALIAKYRAAAQAIVQQPIVQQLPQLL